MSTLDYISSLRRVILTRFATLHNEQVASYLPIIVGALLLRPEQTPTL